jgi:hypothetical protein
VAVAVLRRVLAVALVQKEGLVQARAVDLLLTLAEVPKPLLHRVLVGMGFLAKVTRAVTQIQHQKAAVEAAKEVPEPLVALAVAAAVRVALVQHLLELLMLAVAVAVPFQILHLLDLGVLVAVALAIILITPVELVVRQIQAVAVAVAALRLWAVQVQAEVALVTVAPVS